MANYLWAGGEDTSFPNGAAVSVSTNMSLFRSAYARCAISGGSSLTNPCRSNPFTGGAVASLWLSCRHFSGNTAYLGVGKSGQNNFLAVESSGLAVTLGTVVSGTFTALASIVTISSAGVDKFDMQVSGWGTGTVTINVYVNGQQIIAYSGSPTISGVTSFDTVFMSSSSSWTSEIVVSDSSTLAFQGLCTVAGAGNGTTQAWSNPAYTNWNPTTINDANATFTNTTGQDEQANINALASGSFVIAAVKFEARAMATSGATATNLELGVRNPSGTVGVGGPHALSTTFTTYEDYMTTDPTTGAAWGTLASYQLNLRSA